MSKRSPEKRAAKRAATTPAAKRGQWRPWTPAEDATIRELVFPRGRRRRRVDWPLVLRRLPGRARSSILRRFAKLKTDAPLPSRHWTAAEDKLLRDRWQEDGQRTLMAKLPGRSWEAIYIRAHDLGMSSIPQGWVSFKKEATRLGFDRASALRIVDWAALWAPLVVSLCEWGHQMARCAGVETEYPHAGYDGGAVVTKMHTTSWSGRTPTRRWMLVEDKTLEDAVCRWQSWETAAAAAERYGVRRPLMLRWAHDEYGIRAANKGHLRLPRPWWDAVTSHLVPGGRTIAEHAARTGLPRGYLERCLAKSGVKSNGKRATYADEHVDRLLAEYMRRPSVVAMAFARRRAA